MSSFVILSHSGKKLVEGELWAEVTQVRIWGHMKFLPSMSWVIWDHFHAGIIFHYVTLLNSKKWGVMNFGHIWRRSSKYLTYFHSYWTVELWMVKVHQRSVVGRGHTDCNLGSHEFYPVYPESYESYCLSVIFPSVTFFAVKEVRGNEFWTHLKIFVQIFDLLPFLWQWNCEWWNGVISGIDAHGN